MMDEPTALLITTLITGVILITSGWLLVRVSRNAASGKLARNRIAGIRTSVTLSSEAAWRAAHVAAEKDSVIGAKGVIIGGLLGVLSGCLAFLGVPFFTTPTVFSAILFGSAVWLLVWTLKGAGAGQRAAARVASVESSHDG